VVLFLWDHTFIAHDLALAAVTAPRVRDCAAAEVSNAAPAKRIAVLNFSTNNAPEFLSRVVRNVMEVAIFASGEFQLLEWEHIQKVLKGSAWESKGDPDAADSIELGEKLKADYLVVGSIDKTDDYRITARVISVDEKKILIAYSKKFSSAGDIDRVAEKMAQDVNDDIRNYVRTGILERRFYDTYKIVMGLEGQCVNPLGIFHAMVNAGYGFIFTTAVQNVLLEDFFLGVGVGYYRFSGRASSSDSLTIVPIYLNIGYTVRFYRRFFIQPVLSPGFAFISLKHGREPGFDMPADSERSYSEPMLSAGVYLGLNPLDRMALKLGMRYEFIYEPADLLQVLIVGIGLYYSF